MCDNTSLRCSFFCCEEFITVHDLSFEPSLHGTSHNTERLKFFQQRLMVDTVKAFRNISIKHKLSCVLDTLLDCFYRIMGRPSRSKAITVRLKASFPFWLQCHFCQSLLRSVLDSRDA